MHRRPLVLTKISNRVLSFSDTEKVSLWFNGPQFLHLPQDQWPEREIEEVASNDPEVKVEVKVNVCLPKPPSLITIIEERIFGSDKSVSLPE